MGDNFNAFRQPFTNDLLRQQRSGEDLSSTTSLMPTDSVINPEGCVNSLLIWCLLVVCCHVTFLLIDVISGLRLRGSQLRRNLPVDPSKLLTANGSIRSAIKRSGKKRESLLRPFSTALLSGNDTIVDSCWGDFSLSFHPESSETWEFHPLKPTPTESPVRNPDLVNNMSTRYCSSKRGSLQEEPGTWPTVDDPSEIDLESALWSLGFGYGELDPNLRIPNRFMQKSSVLDTNLLSNVLESSNGCGCACHPGEMVNFTISDYSDQFDIDPELMATTSPTRVVVDSILNEKNRQFLESFYLAAAAKVLEEKQNESEKLSTLVSTPPVQLEISPMAPAPSEDVRKTSVDYQLRKASRKLTRSSKIPLEFLQTSPPKSNSFESEDFSTSSDNVFLAPNVCAMGTSFNSESSGFADSDSPVPKMEHQHDDVLVERDSPTEDIPTPTICDSNSDKDTMTTPTQNGSIGRTVRRNPFLSSKTQIGADWEDLGSPIGLQDHFLGKQLRSRSHSTPTQPDKFESNMSESVLVDQMNKFDDILANCAEKIGAECNFDDQFKQLQPLLPLGSRLNLETVRVTRLDVQLNNCGN